MVTFWDCLAQASLVRRERKAQLDPIAHHQFMRPCGLADLNGERNGRKIEVDKSGFDVYIHIMPEQLDMASVENCTCFNVRRVARVITQFFDAEVRRHGIRPTQTPILGALQAKSGWGMAELSDWLGMERTTLLRNLRPLQRDGLVRASGGGRGGHVELAITEKGRTALAKMLPAWRSAQNKVVATLGKERWSAIITDLEEVASKLKA
jgi:DNA-binding MarR family transcriptional regulator